MSPRQKGRTKREVDAVIHWLTGYSQQELDAVLEAQKDFETFFNEAPRMNPSRTLIQGVVCEDSGGRHPRADDARDSLSGQTGR